MQKFETVLRFAYAQCAAYEKVGWFSYNRIMKNGSDFCSHFAFLTVYYDYDAINSWYVLFVFVAAADSMNQGGVQLHRCLPLLMTRQVTKMMHDLHDVWKLSINEKNSHLFVCLFLWHAMTISSVSLICSMWCWNTSWNYS